jgi:hypothetical protein
MSELVSVKSASERGYVSRRTIHRWIRDGSLQKVGNKVRFDDVAELITRRVMQPRRGPRPGRAHWQVTFRNNGFPVPRAQKRLSDVERAQKISEQLVRIRSPYVLDQLAKQAFRCALLRENERALGTWTKPEDLLAQFRNSA